MSPSFACKFCSGARAKGLRADGLQTAAFEVQYNLHGPDMLALLLNLAYPIPVIDTSLTNSMMLIFAMLLKVAENARNGAGAA